jgi:hypothetical protein
VKDIFFLRKYRRCVTDEDSISGSFLIVIEQYNTTDNSVGPCLCWLKRRLPTDDCFFWCMETVWLCTWKEILNIKICRKYLSYKMFDVEGWPTCRWWWFEFLRGHRRLNLVTRTFVRLIDMQNGCTVLYRHKWIRLWKWKEEVK